MKDVLIEFRPRSRITFSNHNYNNEVACLLLLILPLIDSYHSKARKDSLKPCIPLQNKELRNKNLSVPRTLLD